MAILQHSVSAHTGTSSSRDVTLSAGSNRRVFVGLQSEGTGNWSAPVFGGVTMSLVTDGSVTASQIVGSGTTQQSIEFYQLLESQLPANGTVSLQSNRPSSSNNCSVHYILLSDVDQTSNVSDVTTNSASPNSSATLSVTVSSPGTDAVVLSVYGNGNSVNPTATYNAVADTSEQELDTGTTTTGLSSVWLPSGVSGNATLTVTPGATTNRHALIGFSVAAAVTEIDSDGATTLPTLTGSGTSDVEHDSSGAATLQTLTGSGTSDVEHGSSGAATLPTLEGNGSTNLSQFGIIADLDFANATVVSTRVTVLPDSEGGSSATDTVGSNGPTLGTSNGNVIATMDGSQYLSWPLQDTVNRKADNQGYAMWLRPHVIPPAASYQEPFSAWNDPEGAQRFNITQENGHIQFYFGPADPDDVLEVTNFWVVNEWRFIYVFFSGGTFTFRSVNETGTVTTHTLNVLVGDGVLPTTLAQVGNNILIGAYDTAETDAWNGDYGQHIYALDGPLLSESEVLQLASIDSPVNLATEIDSSGAATLPALTGTGASDVEHDSSGATTLPALTGSGTSTETHSSAGAAILPELSGSGTSDVEHDSTGTTTLPALTGTGASDVEHASSGAPTLQELTGSGLSDVEHGSAGAATLPELTATGESGVEHDSSGATTLPALTGAGASNLTHDSSGAATLQELTGSGLSDVEHDSSGAAVLPSLIGFGSGDGAIDSSGAAIMPTLAGSGTSDVEHDSAGAATLPELTASGTTTLTHDSSGAVVLPALTGTGTSDREAFSQGAAVLPELTASGTTTLTHDSSGAATLPELEGNGSTVFGIESSGAAVLPSLLGSGTSEKVIISEGAATLPALTGSGVSTRTINSFGTLGLPALTGSGLSTLTFDSSGNLTLPALTGSGSSVVAGFVIFIVEDGTGLANANAYISVDFMRQYWLDHGTALAFSDTQLQYAIIQATDYIDLVAQERFRGFATKKTQSLSFPRTAIFGPGGISLSGVPSVLKKAVAEYAFIALSQDLFQDPSISPAVLVTRDKVGPLETEVSYIGGFTSTINDYVKADGFLMQLTYGLSSVSGRATK